MTNEKITRSYKDSLFRMVFREKTELLSLYNAINGTDYDDPEAVKGVGIINIAKQRDGRTGKVKFAYNESLTRISDATDQGQCPF